MANRYGNKQKVKGGVLKRSRRRAKALGREGVLEGGVTGAEARSLKRGYVRSRGGSGGSGGSGGVRGGVKRRAESRIDYLRDHGGVPGGVRTKDGISRREARKVRRAYVREIRNDPLRPRGGRALLNEAESLTDVEFGPQEAELGRQRANEVGRQNVLFGQGGFFERYQADVAAAAQRQQTADQAFQAGQNAAVQQAYQQWQVQQAADDEKAAKTSAKGGTSVDPMLAQMAAQAAAGRQQAGQNAAALIGQQGSANAAYMNSQAVAATQQRGEGMMESNARLAKIDALGRELAQQRGAYKTKAIGELKDTERTYDLNRSAFGLDVAEAAEDRRHNKETERENRRKRRAAVRQNNRTYRKWKREFGAERADEMFDRMEKDRRYQLDVEKFGETKAQNRWNRRHGGKNGVPTAGPKHGFSEAEQDKFDSAVNLLQAIDRKKGQGHVRKTRVDAVTALVQDKNIPPRIARRAVKYYLRPTKRRGSATPRNSNGTPG